MKDYEKSKKYFADYINEADIHTEDELIDAYTGLGLSCEGLKQYEESEKAYLNAISYIEEKRKRLLLTDRQKEILFSDSSCQINCGVTALSKPEYVSFFSQTIFSKLLPYESLIRVYHNLNRDRDCFYYSEAIKARILLEAIAGKHKSSAYKVPQEIIDKEKELFYSEDLEDTYEKLTKERMEEYVNSGVIEEFGEQLREYALKQEAFLKELRLKYPEYAAVKYPRPLPLDDIKLSPGEVAIEYEVIDDCTVAWLIKEGAVVKSISIPVKREELNNLVNEYRNYFSTVKDYSELSSFKPETGKKLYDLLLKDLFTEIKGEKIIIIPDEILGVLPFEALVAEMPSQVNIVQGQFGPYPEGLTYVGDKYTLTYSLSLTALNNAKILSKNKGATKGFFAVADPVFTSSDERLTGIAVNTPVPSATPVPGTVAAVTPTAVPSAPDNSSELARDMQNNINAINTGKYKLKLMDAVADKYNINISRLPLTGEMLKDLIKIYPGEIKSLSGPDATEKNIKAQNLSEYKYVLIATHGILDRDIPYIKEPALVLTLVNNEDDDGFLTAGEVMNLKLNADVAVLSACKTGVGKTVSGEGVMGLGRSFQYAGAGNILMSLWSVESRSTNMMTEKFFEYLKVGKSNSEALREARAFIRKEGYEHPFFWASFILMGD